MRFLPLLSLLLVVFNLHGQLYLNLDFETGVYPTLIPKKWKLDSHGYKVGLDSLEAYSGNFSLLIQNSGGLINKPAEVITTLPFGFAFSSTIILSAKVKIVETFGEYPKIFARIENSDGVIIREKLSSYPVESEQGEWTNLQLEIKVPPEGKKFDFGATFNGRGKIRIDAFELLIDNQEYTEKPPLSIYPTEKELEWLRENIHPISTSSPDVLENESFQWLDTIMSNKKIVALGEVTHGSMEIFNLKHKLIKYLVTQQNFDLFGIEGNMTEAFDINQFVLHNNGDPQALIAGMGFWTWNTQEMLDMVRWFNKHNRSHYPKIKFTGFDMQSHKGPIKLLKSMAVGKARGIVDNLGRSLDSVKNEYRYGLNLGSYYSEDLNFLKDWYSKKLNEHGSKQWVLQNITILEQMVNNYKYGMRDGYMVDNVEWILDQNPNSKMVLWAHNGHIKKSGGSMGYHLGQKYKKEYLSVGFAFAQGSYTAKGEFGLTTYPAERSYPGTFEFFFSAIDQPIFMLDLRNLDASNENQQWLLNQMGFRQTGGLKVDEEFYESTISKDFDIIIFINQTNPTQLITK